MKKSIRAYGLMSIPYIGLCYIKTRLFYPHSRFIKFPFDIRGRAYIDLGDNLTLGKNCRFEVFPNLIEDKNTKKLVIGSNVVINDFVHITALGSVRIGNNVLMASHIYISDCQHGIYEGKESSSPKTVPMERPYLVGHVSIGDNVWIGEHVSILPGVTIGEGSVVGANSVVSHSIPPYCIAVGSPAHVIKKYNFEANQWEKV